jgi:small-conductance mechanosensitive channel
VLPLVALLLVFQAAPDDLRFIGSVRHLNGLLLIAAATWLIVRAISGFADGVLAQHPSDVADNLQARRVLTQTRVLARTAMSVVLVAGGAMMLMTFPGARQVGASLLASAGVIGIVAGLAAKPVFSNLIAGLQIALAQPIRIDDVLVVEGEWGRVEEITGTFVVLQDLGRAAPHPAAQLFHREALPELDAPLGAAARLGVHLRSTTACRSRRCAPRSSAS